MPTVKVPLFDTAYTNTQGTVLNDKLSSFVNGYIDDLGGYHRFPGTLSLNDFGLGAGVTVDGVYWWQQGGKAIVVIAGRVFGMTYLGGVATLTELLGATLATGKPVVFATDGTYVFMANGGRIVYTDGVVATYMADPDVPITISHVAYLDGYILAAAAGNKWYYSNVNDSLNWSALNFASASSNPDDITALHVLSREVFLFGPLTIEVWENDGTSPFSRVPGGAIQVGCGAPYSVTPHFAKNAYGLREEGCYFLNNKRQFLFYNGRSLAPIECAFQKDIQGFSSVSDCIGMAIEIAAQDFLIFTFPTADRTFLYNIGTKQWQELGKWNITNANYQRWIGNSYTYCQDWNLHLLGGANTSKIYSLATSYNTENGDLLRDARRSGDIDYGTSKQKRSNEFRVRLKRGEGGSTTPVIMFRYRVNGKTWSQERQVSLGDSGQYDIFQKIPARGLFRSRQYEITSTDNVEIVQADAEEDIDILR